MRTTLYHGLYLVAVQTSVSTYVLTFRFISFAQIVSSDIVTFINVRDRRLCPDEVPSLLPSTLPGTQSRKIARKKPTIRTVPSLVAVSLREDDSTIDVEEFMKYVSTQTEENELESVSKLRESVTKLRENVELEKKVNDQSKRLSQQLFKLSLTKGDDGKFAFYTGFTS